MSIHIKYTDFINEKISSTELFPRIELINLFKEHKFKFTDSSLISNFEYIGSENPFDINFIAKINFNNGLLVVIKRENKVYRVRIGENTGWLGGLEKDFVEYSFTINKLDFEELKTAFVYATTHQEYSLVSKHNTGNIDEILCVGSVSDFKQFAKDNGYEIVKTEHSIIDFYLTKYALPRWDNKRLLSIYVL